MKDKITLLMYFYSFENRKDIKRANNLGAMKKDFQPLTFAVGTMGKIGKYHGKVFYINNSKGFYIRFTNPENIFYYREYTKNIHKSFI